MRRERAKTQVIPAAATGAQALGAAAHGALAVGAVAIGAIALGAVAIGRLSIGRAHIRRLQIDELVVRQPRVELSPAESTVREFWRRMASNDFESVAAVLAPEFVMEWPQSRERIRGPDRFCRMNAEYPAGSRWQFRVNRLVAAGDTVVTQTSVTDGTQAAEPVSFFTVGAGGIIRLVEYWPEPFAPAENRRHLTERME